MSQERKKNRQRPIPNDPRHGKCRCESVEVQSELNETNCDQEELSTRRMTAHGHETVLATAATVRPYRHARPSSRRGGKGRTMRLGEDKGCGGLGSIGWGRECRVESDHGRGHQESGGDGLDEGAAGAVDGCPPALPTDRRRHRRRRQPHRRPSRPPLGAPAHLPAATKDSGRGGRRDRDHECGSGPLSSDVPPSPTRARALALRKTDVRGGRRDGIATPSASCCCCGTVEKVCVAFQLGGNLIAFLSSGWQPYSRISVSHCNSVGLPSTSTTRYEVLLSSLALATDQSVAAGAARRRNAVAARASDAGGTLERACRTGGCQARDASSQPSPDGDGNGRGYRRWAKGLGRDRSNRGSKGYAGSRDSGERIDGRVDGTQRGTPIGIYLHPATPTARSTSNGTYALAPNGRPAGAVTDHEGSEGGAGDGGGA